MPSTRPTVALFVTCVVDVLTPDVGVAAVRLLESAGCEVVVPESQTCCGQPACNAGEPEAAARLARHHVDIFEQYEAVVAPSGSCAAMVHHWYDRLLRGGDRVRARALAERTFELTDYIADELGRVELGARVDAIVTVHDACHGLRTLARAEAERHARRESALRELLNAAGATVVELAEPETCCGFGGTFAVTHTDISTALADAKLDGAAATGAGYLVSTDAACLVHLEGRRRRTSRGPEPIHVAELLARGLP